MKKNIAFVLISLFIYSCDGITSFDNQPDDLVIGSRTYAILQTDPSLVDSVYKDFEHLDSRDLDLNNDMVKEFFIISEEDSVFESGSNDFLYFRKRLSIEKNGSYEGRLSVVVDGDGNIKIFNFGDVVNPDNQQIEIINRAKHFCDFSIDVNQQALNYGHWNGETDRYFVVTTLHNDIYIASWMRITVEKFDNYVFYGFASFNVDWDTYKD